MKTKFRGLIRHSASEFDELWKTAVFAFDANVLLNAYRLEKKSATAFLDLLTPLKGRAWLPHQVGVEFFRQRDAEIQKQFTDYQAIKKHLGGLADNFKGQFQRHLHIPLEEVAAALTKLANEWEKQLCELEKGHHNPTYDDPTLAVYLDVFDGMVGDKPSVDDLKQWHKEADERYAKKIPPGFEDAKKKDGREYGDVILWFQLLEYAKKEKKPVIFVTDDAKEDWWQRISGKTLGPHPLLSQEMYEKAGILFHAYPMHRFVEEAARRAGKEAGKDVIENIKVAQGASSSTSEAVALSLRLTPEAVELLITALVGNGIISHRKSKTGRDAIIIGDRDFLSDPNPNARRAWTRGLQQLIQENLIRLWEVGPRKNSYHLTDQGLNVGIHLRWQGTGTGYVKGTF